jgi:hypothetical protein
MIIPSIVNVLRNRLAARVFPAMRRLSQVSILKFPDLFLYIAKAQSVI